MRSSAEGGVGGAAFGDLGFEPVPDCQQLLLVDDVLAAVLEVVLEHVGFDDRVHRARFLAEPAEDALEQVDVVARRSEEHTSELQSLMRISYAVFCLKKKNTR